MKFSRVLAAGALLVAASLASVPAQAEDSSQVSILHAIPGATVDVYANGAELLTNFKPGTLTDPQMLPADTYDIKVVAAGAGKDGDAIVEVKALKVPAGANLTLVANLSAEGSPALNAFANDTSRSDAGARLTVRHVAAAPAVDVRAGGKVVVKSLTNPKEAKLDLAPGKVSADVVAAGTDTVVLGPADVELSAGKNTIVYAWGSLEDKTLALAVQTVPLTKPSMPSTGAEGPDPMLNLWIALGAVAVVAVAGSAVLITRRHPARNR